MKALAVIGAMLCVFGAIATGIYLGVRNYHECRAHGFSRFYCWSLESGK